MGNILCAWQCAEAFCCLRRAAEGAWHYFKQVTAWPCAAPADGKAALGISACAVIKQGRDLWMRLESYSPHAATLGATPRALLPQFAPQPLRSPATVPRSPAVTGAMLTVELICSPLPLQFLGVHVETASS